MMCSISRQPWGTSSTDVTLTRLRIEKERSSWAGASQQTSVDHTHVLLPSICQASFSITHQSINVHHITKKALWFWQRCVLFICRMQTPPSLLMKPCSLIAVYKTLTEEWTTCWAPAPASLTAWETRGARLRCVWRTQHRADSTLDQEGEFFPFSYQGVSNSAPLIVDKVLMADTIQFNDSQMKCRQE